MLTTILTLSALTFAVLYPLCFWISVDNPLKQYFHRFHLGLTCCVAGIVVFSFFANSPLFINNQLALIRILGVVWVSSLLLITFFYWHRDYPHPAVLTLPCCLGAYLLFGWQAYYVRPGILAHLPEIINGDVQPICGSFTISLAIDSAVVTLVGGFVLISAIFAMNLGHWYLNVHGLSLHHLKRATQVLGFFALLRLSFDLLQLVTLRVIYVGDEIFLYQFMLTTDGFFLWIALFFGTIFPLAGLYFVNGTLDAKNTQDTTGILYAILSAVFIGDLTYKYYLIKFGFIL